LSLLATMILIGLWHAPTLPYLVWGAATGAVLATHAALRSAGRRAWPAWAGRSATFIALLAGWVLLKCPSLETAGTVYAALLGARGVGTGMPPGVTPAVLLALALLLVATNVKLDAAAVVPPRSWIAAAATALLLTLGLLALGAPQPFVYLRF
jgi:D-alanyl-lipoteichoic acid acyltransferase DltB (MBOAT superfamily)